MRPTVMEIFNKSLVNQQSSESLERNSLERRLSRRQTIVQPKGPNSLRNVISKVLIANSFISKLKRQETAQERAERIRDGLSNVQRECFISSGNITRNLKRLRRSLEREQLS